MRQVVRPAIRLPTLAAIETSHGEGWKQTGLGGPKDDLWNNPDVRGALYAMHGRACVYCQQYLPENDRGDVEHFRPKSIYHWLAYAFDNYLLSCGICNRVLKRDHFPLRPGAVAISYPERHRLEQEARLLLDPATDPTETWIEYDIFNSLCAAVPASNVPPPALPQVETTISFFRLTTRSRLIQSRLEMIDKTEELLEDLDAGRQRNANSLKRLASRYAPHGLIVRKILSKVRPALLPTAKEELEFLVEALCNDLELTDRTRPPGRDRGLTQTWERIRRELIYSLAVIWLAPLGATPLEVEQWLEAHNVRRDVTAVLHEITPPPNPHSQGNGP